MRKLSAIHWTIICAAIVSVVLLGFVSTVPPAGKNTAALMPQGAKVIPLEELISKARAQLKAPVQKSVQLITASIGTERDFARRSQMYDSLIRVLSSNENYLLAAWYAEEKARMNNGSGNDWEKAGDRYHDAVQFQQDDQDGIPSLYDAAMRCYKKALELEPKNLDAQVGLGSCIVESTGDPMTGVKMLLHVDSIDSLNIRGQFALAAFDEQSNQLPKAIQRYNRILRLKPEYIDLYTKLADIYRKTGDTAAAIKQLQIFIEIEPDPVIKNQYENEIKTIRLGLKTPDTQTGNK